MQKEILTSETAQEIGDISLTPLVKLTFTWVQVRGSLSFHAVKQPAYLIVSVAGQERVYRINGEEISFEQLMSECPDLRANPVESRHLRPPWHY
jgi:hypothetical protein